ncbi:MAG: carbohydrate binding domain-containing protein [Bacteroidaceae bacterium]|nr:carbohydrate binding domain-containing protein [Bacteroidaceae bacterium]
MLRHFLTTALFLMTALGLRANQPDSVFLFSYNPHPSQGLAFAYSADGSNWKSIADGASFVGSDFGTWGPEKKMHSPILIQKDDGTWELFFRVNNRVNQYARTTSPDLMHWKPQDYPYMKDLATVNSFFAAMERNSFRVIQLDGQERRGCINRVSYMQVESMENFKQAAAYRGRLNSETLADDVGRFADIMNKEVRAHVKVEPTKAKVITDKLIGIFFEDINYSADGGLYAELLQNRDFEYVESDRGREPNWTPTNSWTLKGEGTTFSISTDEPLHSNQSHYAVLDVQAVGAALVNDGFDGIVVRKGEKYDISLFARQLGGKAGKFRIQLRKGETVIGETTLPAPGKNWKQVKGVIISREDVSDATLAIIPTAVGEVALDFVSLFPQKTFKNRKNGLRPDLAQVLADLHPRFMRFPGGCVAHGDGLGNMYHWKQTIGPLWERQPLRNIWGYHQTRGLGYFEFFQMCEDLGCEPLPVVPAAVPCQNSSTGGDGQMGGIPFGPEFDQYKQDILDLVEWANGDPKTSQWARMRAEAGHPKPFNLKYIGIGNEDLISEVFTERYLPLIKAVKERYPDIIVCGTTGPFYEGSDYEQGWRLAKDNKIDMVDEHYYVSPGWYIHHQDFYDQYDRSASQVYLGEYASHGPGRKSTIETALTCAMHICGLERNGDIVHMSSYAPLLAKNGHTQWNPDLIYFDNQNVYPTVDYYVQLMCGQSQGNRYLPTAVTLEGQRPDVSRRMAVSTVYDTVTGNTYIKLVNLLPTTVTTTLELGDLTPAATAATSITLAGAWNDQQARPTAPAAINLAAPVTLPAYSFTVITIPPLNSQP